MAHLVQRDGKLELGRVHALQTHHLGLEETAAPARDPMSRGCASASQARRATQLRLRTGHGGVDVHDVRLLGRIRALADQPLGLGLDVRGGHVRGRHRSRPPHRGLGASVQKVLDPRARDGLRKLEAAVVARLEDADPVAAAAIVRHSVVPRVQDLEVDVVIANGVQLLVDLLQDLAPPHRPQPGDVFQDEGLRSLLLDVLEDLEEDLATALLVPEALPEAGHGEGLAGEAGDVQVHIRSGLVVALAEVFVEDIVVEVRLNGLLRVLVDVAREDMLVRDLQVADSHDGRFHAAAVGSDADRPRSNARHLQSDGPRGRARPMGCGCRAN
mmetsp:Transcript_42933/g.122758  ORF Transcript_42933/g.122758 Transcript_42933/m.122758 type:complete len:328 (+) Transcript_42933:420-1403(+)